ncbi:tetraspanin-33 isoform X2 [Lingula anatina]|uniref:Tetraspanin-33 n=1 Tax=Lingula anatina TaxID=7574 RepID=A0A1S3K3D7_LINAN|nr:tetraspanin-33 isoform X2 [Lingula anatina]|eukprot:XP_013416776.1 tetraspanin-33 isoform X2 [Lingula anatina]
MQPYSNHVQDWHESTSLDERVIRTHGGCCSVDDCCLCETWTKYSLFGINFLVWLAGGAFIGIGSWARIEKQGFASLDSVITDPAFLVLAVGCAMFVISFFGCLGALRENICLLQTFCAILVLVFLAELASGVIAFVFLDHITAGLTKYTRQAIVNYQDDLDLQNAIDYIQSEYKCCGGSGYNDWDVNIYFNCSSAAVSHCGVPMSCCKQQTLPQSLLKNIQCGYGSRSLGEQSADNVIHTNGCIGALLQLFRDQLFIIGLIAFSVGFLELFAILLACNMIKIVTKARLSYAEHRRQYYGQDHASVHEEGVNNVAL